MAPCSNILDRRDLLRRHMSEALPSEVPEGEPDQLLAQLELNERARADRERLLIAAAQALEAIPVHGRDGAMTQEP